MMFKKLCLILCLLLFIRMPVPSLVFAQTQMDSGNTEKVLSADLTKLIMENPETINRLILDATKNESDLLSKLIDLGNIKFNVSEMTGNQDDETSLGIEYGIMKDIVRKDFVSSGPANYNGLLLNFSSEGHLFLNHDIITGPEDFTDTSFSFMFFKSKGGAVQITEEVAKELNALEDLAVESVTMEELSHNPAVLRAAKIIRSNLSTQFYIEISANGGLESNQSLNSRQYYYGVHSALDIKAWNPDSAWAKFNIFDYPFALSRYMFNIDQEWRPRGSSIPILLVGLDHVNPREGTPRTTIINEQSEFERFRFEASYRTLAGELNDEPIYFEADLKYYQEFGASDTTQKINLDHFSMYSMALLFSNGMYISYCRGKLPLDLQNEQIYSIGFNYSF